jgi:hypothetical protein
VLNSRIELKLCGCEEEAVHAIASAIGVD